MIEVAVKDYTAITDSPVGMLGILDNGQVIEAVNFLYNTVKMRKASSELAEKTVYQLEQFFLDPNSQFDLPIAASSTPFQMKVRNALLSIPVGKTMTYGNVAKTIASSARAIAGGCRRNPVPIIVPCHRIVAANGLGGFSGALDGPPLATKKWLLEHERTSRY